MPYTKPKLPHDRSIDRIEVNIFVIQSYLYEISYALKRVEKLLNEIEKLNAKNKH